MHRNIWASCRWSLSVVVCVCVCARAKVDIKYLFKHSNLATLWLSLSPYHANTRPDCCMNDVNWMRLKSIPHRKLVSNMIEYYTYNLEPKSTHFPTMRLPGWLCVYLEASILLWYDVDDIIHGDMCMPSIAAVLTFPTIIIIIVLVSVCVRDTWAASPFWPEQHTGEGVLASRRPSLSVHQHSKNHSRGSSSPISHHMHGLCVCVCEHVGNHDQILNEWKYLRSTTTLVANTRGGWVDTWHI